MLNTRSTTAALKALEPIEQGLVFSFFVKFPLHSSSPRIMRPFLAAGLPQLCHGLGCQAEGYAEHHFAPVAYNSLGERQYCQWHEQVQRHRRPRET